MTILKTKKFARHYIRTFPFNFEPSYSLPSNANTLPTLTTELTTTKTPKENSLLLSEWIAIYR